MTVCTFALNTYVEQLDARKRPDIYVLLAHLLSLPSHSNTQPAEELPRHNLPGAHCGDPAQQPRFAVPLASHSSPGRARRRGRCTERFFESLKSVYR